MVRLTLLFFTSAVVVALAGLATSKRLPEDDIHTLSYKVLVVVMTSYKLLLILGDWLVDCCWTAGVTTAAASAVVEADDDETAAAAGLFAGLLIRRLASSRENKTLGTEDDSLALILPSVLLIEVTVLLLLDESSTVKSQCSKKWGKQSVYHTPPLKEVAIQCFWK